MRKFFEALLGRLGRQRTVDTIMRPITKLVDQLEQHEMNKINERIKHYERVDFHVANATAADVERVKARDAKQQLRSMFGAGNAK